MAEKYLTVDEILTSDDLPEEDITIPEWGGVVKVRGMNAEERLTWTQECKNDKGEIDMEKATFMAIVIGVQEPKFEAAHIPALRKKSALALDKITTVWLKLSGLGEAALMEARGNS